LLGYDSNSHACSVFNKDSGCVEITCDTVFDETNDSQVEQYDLDVIHDEEAPCDALQRMVIEDVRPQDLTEHQASQAPNDTTPHTQDQEEDKENEHEDEQEEPQNKDQAHDQEENIDQGRDEDDREHEGSRTRPPHPRMRQTVRRDHPMNNILGDIKKRVTTKSHVATFYQHHSFISSLEYFNVEDILHDPNWVVVMQEELNNFKCNKV
jgi:hypothetical protein